MSTVDFLQPRLCGPRFEGGGIPLEVLKDLAVLKEMLREVAKWRFLQEHPDRRHSPWDFTEDLELKLFGMEAGSAHPVISLSDTSPPFSRLPRENQVYFEQARDAIIGAVRAAENNGPITDHLPKKHLGYFNRMGRSLRDAEFIEFVSSPRDTPVRLTKETRHRLVLASSVAEIAGDVRLRGGIPKADQDERTFEFQPINGQKVVAVPIPDQHLDTVVQACSGYADNTRVLLEGVGRYDRQDRLVGVESVEHLSLLDPLDVPARLDEFRAMTDGWLEGQGEVPDTIGLDWLAAAFERLFPDETPLPYVYPTPEGGVQMEWSSGADAMTLEIDLRSRQAEWLWFDRRSDAEHERRLNLDETEAWEWLVAEVRNKAESGA